MCNNNESMDLICSTVTDETCKINYYFNCDSKYLVYFIWDSEFSSYEIELRNQVTQDDVTLWVTNSKILTEILLSSYSFFDFVKY